MTASPAAINLKLYPFATFSELTTLQDSLGDPLDLTGKTARCEIRREDPYSDPVFLLTTENGGIQLGGALGTVALELTSDETGTPVFDPLGEVLYYDVLLTTPGGSDDTVERIFGGFIYVLPGITRPAA